MGPFSQVAVARTQVAGKFAAEVVWSLVNGTVIEYNF